MTTFMEDNLKILKEEYISNHLLDSTQILNLCLDDLTILYKSFKWRWPPMEVNLKILKVEYIRNPVQDHTQVLNWSLDDQTLFLDSQNEDDLRWKATSKYQK